MFQLTIPGNPIPQKRPKFSSRGKFVQVYNPGKKDQDVIKILLKQIWEHEPISDPVELDITFYMPIPKGTSKIKYKEMVSDQINHVKKPDVDNLLKTVLDCMNDIVFEDDRQVHKITANKRYGETPRTEIKVTLNAPHTNLPK